MDEPRAGIKAIILVNRLITAEIGLNVYKVMVVKGCPHSGVGYQMLDTSNVNTQTNTLMN